MEGLQQLFDPNEVMVALLTGPTKTKERCELLEKLEREEISIVIGTHALPQDGVEFQNLGLAITDK